MSWGYRTVVTDAEKAARELRKKGSRNYSFKSVGDDIFLRKFVSPDHDRTIIQVIRKKDDVKTGKVKHIVTDKNEITTDLIEKLTTETIWYQHGEYALNPFLKFLGKPIGELVEAILESE